jgi:GNAT superfamily N-acetyltransferase
MGYMQKIELLSAGNLKLVQDIAFKTWPGTYGDILEPKQVEYMLDKMYSLPVLRTQQEKGHLFYLFREDGHPLGFMGIEPHAEPDSLKIHKLYVLPEAQGKKVGAQLLAFAELIAKSNQLRRIFLNVNRHNKAKDFYESRGMTVFREENIDIGNGYLMEDYVMEKRV